MHHDDGADDTSRKTPGCLVHIFQCIVFICECHVECTCESIAEVVAGSALQRFSVMHQCFDRISFFRACKFFFVGLAALDHRECQIFLAEIRIGVQHQDRTFLCFFCRCVYRMTFLP